jgi:hypothetical protein
LFETKRRADRLGGTGVGLGAMLVAATPEGGAALALDLLPQTMGWRA